MPAKFQASRFNNIKNIASRSIPLSILYRLFFETQGRKHGRILSWSWCNNFKSLYLRRQFLKINLRYIIRL